MLESESPFDPLTEIADLLEGIPARLAGTTIEQRKIMTDQAGRWVMEAVHWGAFSRPRWSSFHGTFNERMIEFLNDNYALLFTEMVTWCRDNAALVPAEVDVPADLKRPPTYAINSEITFDPERWLRYGCPLFAKLIRPPREVTVASAANTNFNVSEDFEKDVQPPALTEAQRITLCAMNSFDRTVLASAQKICEAINPTKRLSEETVRQCIKRLIKLDLVERPEGSRKGARLTNAGRRLAGKIVD
jgi:hypothetical protein